MISCRDVSTLVSSDSLEGQPLRRRLAARMHLLMCRACRRFAAGAAVVRQAAGASARAFDDEAEGLEERIVDAMGNPGRKES